MSLESKITKLGNLIGEGINRSLVGKVYGSIQTRISISRNRGVADRKLEIGPGEERIEGFETLNIYPGKNVDYACDAAGRLPFDDGDFSIVYASHILEHIPWYQVADVLKEWVRVLKPGGRLEIWVPDGLKICKAWVNAETDGSREFEDDNWFRFNPDRDPCIWASGRIFTYGDGTGRINDPNWHRSVFSERYLAGLLEKAGLSEVRRMDPKDVRGFDHGWINMGFLGIK